MRQVKRTPLLSRILDVFTLGVEISTLADAMDQLGAQALLELGVHAPVGLVCAGCAIRVS